MQSPHTTDPGPPLSMNKKTLTILLLWLTATAIATSFAYMVRTSAQMEGSIVPMGNDSFYHARRMIDTATSGHLVEFDDKIHAFAIR